MYGTPGVGLVILPLSHHLKCAVHRHRFAKRLFLAWILPNGVSERDRKWFPIRFASRCDAYHNFQPIFFEAYVNNVVPNRIIVRHR